MFYLTKKKRITSEHKKQRPDLETMRTEEGDTYLMNMLSDKVCRDKSSMVPPERKHFWHNSSSALHLTSNPSLNTFPTWSSDEPFSPCNSHSRTGKSPITSPYSHLFLSSYAQDVFVVK